MGREFIAGGVTIATGVIVASIVYQVVKQNSNGFKVVQSLGDTSTKIVGNLFTAA